MVIFIYQTKFLVPRMDSQATAFIDNLINNFGNTAITAQHLEPLELMTEEEN